MMKKMVLVVGLSLGAINVGWALLPPPLTKVGDEYFCPGPHSKGVEKYFRQKTGDKELVIESFTSSHAHTNNHYMVKMTGEYIEYAITCHYEDDEGGGGYEFFPTLDPNKKLQLVMSRSSKWEIQDKDNVDKLYMFCNGEADPLRQNMSCPFKAV